MNARSVLACLVGGVLLLQLHGCGGEEPHGPQVSPSRKIRVKAKRVAKDAAASQRADSAPEKVKYVYDPAGRRDPFEVLAMIKKPVVEQNAALTPLQKYDLGQFRLRAVILGKGEPAAMVEVPGGKAYVVKNGDKIGKNGGVITKVALETVFVEEKYYDFAGDLKRTRQEIRLSKKAGED